MESRTKGDEHNKKPFKRHLQVSSVLQTSERPDTDWNRKAHSSPSRGYRRFSNQEANDKSEVS